MTTAIAFSRKNGAGSRVHYLGCARLGNPDLDFEIQISDFAIESEIRKRISPPRNPSLAWISIKKSKSGFHALSVEIRFRIPRSIANPNPDFKI